MKRLYRRLRHHFQTRRTVGALIVVFLLMIVLLVAPSALHAQGGIYTLAWWTIGGGGNHSSGGPYAVNGTIGQPDAGTLSGGQYSVVGGYWAAALSASNTSPGSYRVFLPLLARES